MIRQICYWGTTGGTYFALNFSPGRGNLLEEGIHQSGTQTGEEGRQKKCSSSFRSGGLQEDLIAITERGCP